MSSNLIPIANACLSLSNQYYRVKTKHQTTFLRNQPWFSAKALILASLLRWTFFVIFNCDWPICFSKFITIWSFRTPQISWLLFSLTCAFVCMSGRPHLFEVSTIAGDTFSWPEGQIVASWIFRLLSQLWLVPRVSTDYPHSSRWPG